MQNPRYDKNDAFIRQKKLLEAKRDRLNDLLDLLNKLIKGEKSMSFKEFDMSGYFDSQKNSGTITWMISLKYGAAWISLIRQ